MTKLKPNHIQIDVSKFDAHMLEYYATLDRGDTTSKYIAKVVGEAYLEQKSSIIPPEPEGLGAVVAVQCDDSLDTLLYTKADNEPSYTDDASRNANWIDKSTSDWVSWHDITSTPDATFKIVSKGVVM